MSTLLYSMKKSEEVSVDKISSDIQAKLDTMVDDINKTNSNVKKNWDNLVNKYNLKESQQQILYDNIEKIVDVAISPKRINKCQYTIIGPAWSVIASEYLKDTLLELNKVYLQNKNIKNLPIHLITEKQAKEYFCRLLSMYDLEEK
jgi:hypothetical protein